MTAASAVVWLIAGVLLLFIIVRFGVLLTRVLTTREERGGPRRPQRHADDKESFLSD